MSASEPTAAPAESRAGEVRLNHLEFVHRPGERALVDALFELLGVEVVEGMFVVGAIHPPSSNHVDNIFAGSEAFAEQLAFDAELARALQTEPLASAYAAFRERLRVSPQWGTHVGIRFDDLSHWQATVDRVQKVDTIAPQLAGRVRLEGVIPPGHPSSVSRFVHQAFMWTDVIAGASLVFGQQIELQHFDFAALTAARG
jgi:hypothetical protein